MLIATAVNAGALLPVTRAAGAAEPVTPIQVIQSFEDRFNVHPGERTNHASTICARGSFVGTAAASALSRSRLFGGDPVPVVAQFSVVGGDASGRSAHEMALEFRLPDGSLQNMAMLNAPVFVAAEPLTFNDMVSAVKPDPSTGEPDQGRLRDFLDLHPGAFARSNFIAATDSTAGYASSSYFSIHTFRLIDARESHALRPVAFHR